MLDCFSVIKCVPLQDSITIFILPPLHCTVRNIRKQHRHDRLHAINELKKKNFESILLGSALGVLAHDADCFATPCSLVLHPFQSLDTSGPTPCPPSPLIASLAVPFRCSLPSFLYGALRKHATVTLRQLRHDYCSRLSLGLRTVVSSRGGYKSCCSRLVPVLERGIVCKGRLHFLILTFGSQSCSSHLWGVYSRLRTSDTNAGARNIGRKEKKGVRRLPAGYGSHPSHFVE